MATCPHCQKSVSLHDEKDDSKEVRREVKGAIKKEIMYSCPHCDRVLGFGFFLGGLFSGRP